MLEMIKSWSKIKLNIIYYDDDDVTFTLMMIYDDVATLRSRTISLILISWANSFIHSWSVGIVTLSVKTSNKWWWCNQSNNIYMITRKYHPLHHHRQKQSLKTIQFHTCWSIPDELAYLKFSRIFSKTFGWNITQPEKWLIHDTGDGCGDFRGKWQLPESEAQKSFKLSQCFVPLKMLTCPRAGVMLPNIGRHMPWTKSPPLPGGKRVFSCSSILW